MAVDTQQERRRVRRLFQFLFWLPLAACTYLALVPEPPEHPVFRLSDVFLHAGAFVYLSGALVLAQYDLPATKGGVYGRTFALMIAYGILLELLQSFIPERSAELKDLLVDVVGIVIGLGAARLLAKPVYRTALGLLSRF